MTCKKTTKSIENCLKILIPLQFFFKENVKYLVWTCRDPISLILGT